MVKYSDSIMEKGKVTALYKRLYWTTAVFSTTFFMVLVGGKYLSRTEPKFTILEQVCLDAISPQAGVSQEEVMSLKIYFIGITLFNLPLEETFKLSLVVDVLVNILSVMMFMAINNRSELLSKVIIAYILTVNLVIMLALPISIMLNIKNKIPCIFKKPGSVHPQNGEKPFYVRRPELIPRKDSDKKIEDISFSDTQSTKTKIEEICSVLRFQYEDSRILNNELL